MWSWRVITSVHRIRRASLEFLYFVTVRTVQISPRFLQRWLNQRTENITEITTLLLKLARNRWNTPPNFPHDSGHRHRHRHRHRLTAFQFLIANVIRIPVLFDKKEKEIESINSKNIGSLRRLISPTFSSPFSLISERFRD